MLLGQYSGKIGAKRRVSIPKKFIKDLGSQLIIAKWYEQCLILVSIEHWQELLNRLTGSTKLITEPVRDVDRFILGSAFEVETDGQGRTVIPDILHEFASLKEEVIFLGLGDRVEMWSREAWEEKEKKIIDQARAALEKMSKK